MVHGEAELAKVSRLVAEAKLLVASQHERIAQLSAAGSSTADAQRTLTVFLACGA